MFLKPKLKYPRLIGVYGRGAIYELNDTVFPYMVVWRDGKTVHKQKYKTFQAAFDYANAI